MQLATVLTPESWLNLRLAAQCGVTEMTTRYPGSDLSLLAKRRKRFAEAGLRLTVVEGFLPIENIKLGRDDGTELTALKMLIQEMGELNIPILCYNFMAGTDWVRTQVDTPERGGAKVTSFSLDAANRAMIPGRGNQLSVATPGKDTISADQLWENLTELLRELIPVAEEAGVVLAMHPDDPPLDKFAGRARIMNSVQAFDQLLDLSDSPSHSICFCQGSFAEMQADIPAAIRRFGRRISYVHFRDVRGSATSFSETFHDNGPTDMVAAMQAYHAIGFRGPIRADHVPQLQGESEGDPGYTTLGRLFAWGYMRGLIQAAANSAPDCEQGESDD